MTESEKSPLLPFGGRLVDASQIIDAVSASFFGMLGVWAAVDRRHWFIRFGVVCGVLLFLLFIPAYELVVIFGVEMTLIATGVWIVRGRRRWRLRLSVETALLTMVIVAIVAAVAARLPDFGAHRWIWLVDAGCRTAMISLTSLWIVTLQRPTWLRLVQGCAAILLLLVALHFMDAQKNALYKTMGGEVWWDELAAHYKFEALPAWLHENLPTLALGMGLMISIMAFAKASCWFTSDAPSEVRPRRLSVLIARGALVLLLFTVAGPTLYLYYRLLTPTPLPVAELPVPNGYDDFIAAGELTPAVIPTLIGVASTPTRAILEGYYHDVEPAVERIAEGLEKNCWVTQLVPTDLGIIDRDYEALHRASRALFIRLRYLEKYGPTDELVETSLQCMRFGHEATRGAGLVEYLSEECENSATASIGSCLGQLNPDQCRAIADSLRLIAARREIAEVRVARQHMIQQNQGWNENLQVLIHDWSTKDPYSMEAMYPRWAITETQLLIANLAVHAFTVEHRHPPSTLAELVPEYLPEVPRDEYRAGPLSYRRDGLTYVIYSFGPDGDDDQGRSIPPTPGSFDSDMIAVGPPPPPFWHNLSKRASIALKYAYERSKGGGAATPMD